MTTVSQELCGSLFNCHNPLSLIIAMSHYACCLTALYWPLAELVIVQIPAVAMVNGSFSLD